MNDNEYGTYNGQMEFTSANIPDPKDCSNLPDEIFEHHIWKHFSFNQWIRVFSLVCKKWKRICEHSTVDPKQIYLHHYRTHHSGQFIQVVKEYQPTILRVKLSSEKLDIFLVHRLCEASKRLHTVVLEYSRCWFDMFVKPISNITTLALNASCSDSFWQNLGTIFPNLKRLQVEQPHSLFNFKVDHLTLIYDRYYDSYQEDNAQLEILKHLNPDVTLFRKDKVIVTKLAGSDSPHSRKLTYEEYFRYFGETELLTELKHNYSWDTEKEEQLFRSGATTMEYEKQLYDSALNYEYPSSVCIPSFDPTAYWSRITEDYTKYNKFVRTNWIPLPASVKFISLSKRGTKEEALEELCKVDDTRLTNMLTGYSIRQAFFDYLLPHATKDELHQTPIIEKVTKIVGCITEDMPHIKLEDLEKIQDLRDWSNLFADTRNVRVCRATVALGCKLSGLNFKKLWEKEEDVGCILDLIAEQDPSNFVELLAYYPLDKLTSIIDKYNIPLTMEKNGESLLNKRIQLSMVTKEELTEYKHLVNHMDSSGITPLLAALERPDREHRNRVCPTVKKLLELGADPTKHRGDKLSPLGLVFVNFYHFLEIYEIIDIVNLLVEYGADINAPCLFEERMCSPLMIAVLNYMYNDVISYLLALGCRADYADETGRTIMDCLQSRFIYKDIVIN